MPHLGHVKHTRGLTETELVMTVSESLCHPWGTLKIPGGLSETESAMKVSESAVGNQFLFKGPDDLDGNGYFLHALVLDRRWVSRLTSTRSTRCCAPCCFFFSAGLKRPGDRKLSKKFLDFERPYGTYTKCCFLDFPVVITIGNHLVFLEPDDLNGLGYLPVCLSSRVHGTRRP